MFVVIKLLMIKFMMIISSIIPMVKTPMTLGFMLLLQTMLSSLLLSKLMLSSWMPMIIFLMLVGGLLILFMYMSSIASNEKFTPNIFITMFFVSLLLYTEEYMFEIQINESQNNFSSTEEITLMKIYNKKTMMITLMMFIYLLLCMIVITSIIKIFKGPLRSKYE